ncbi:MAG: sulfotransferase, partial [Actinomycetota bacterium]|nr:sulfotransferase [Actinomycetota bacterium]
MVAQIDRRFLGTGIANTAVRATSYLYEGRPLTTSGRWINPTIRRALELDATRLSGQHPSRPPAFIVGLGRSGTTLLGQILATHSSIGWLNEPKLVWSLAFPFEDVIGSYRPDAHCKLVLSALDADANGIAFMNAAYCGYSRLVRRSQIVDKYPELVYRREFVERVFPGARFLVLHRDWRAVVRSIPRWSIDNGNVEADWWGLRGRKWRAIYDELVAQDEALASTVSADWRANTQQAMAMVEWVLATERSAEFLGSERALMIDYDELVSAPRLQVARILSFLGVEPEEVVLRFAEAQCRVSEVQTGSWPGIPDALMDRVRAIDSARRSWQ